MDWQRLRTRPFGAARAPRAWRAGGLLALLAIAVACGQPAAAARLGSPAPDFALQNVDGTTVRLSELRGKPVVVNFWATWCAPCREEMPAMQEVYEQYRDRGLVILAVNMEEDVRLVRRWIEQGGFTFTFLLDSEGELVKRYNVTAAPTSYFIGRDGVIRDLKLGALSRSEMQAKVEKLLAESGA
ncbi:MAG TPA: TlpA disulfide reductase family protein [Chloroflexota bacterium]|nr:TlpA disulfide reductase family protein [Chloroflexota bacterium]